MLKLRIRLTVFILWFLLFFNIERLAEMINIASFVYIFAPMMTALIILLPNWARAVGHTYLLTIFTLFFIVIKFVTGYQIMGGMLPITILEICSIYITYFLSSKLSIRVREFEEMITNLTFQQIGLPPKLYESTDTEDLYREVKRCRRFGHPLSLMIVKPVYNKGYQISRIVQEIQTAFAQRYTQVRLAKLYSDRLRDTDLIVIQDDEIILLLPETTNKDAVRLLDKIKSEASSELNIKVSCGSASFPDHSVTLNGLINMAGKNMQDIQANE